MDDMMNGDTSGDRGRWRARTRRAGVLAVTAGAVVLAAACGGSTSSAGSSHAGGSARFQQALAFARCMRSHGVADFPDPNADGRFGMSANRLENHPHFAAAYSACRHLIPNSGSGSNNKVEQNLRQLLQIAQCMRSHGFPEYPDPNPDNSPVNLGALGINTNSPRFQAARQACQRLYPPPDRSPAQGGGS